VRAAITERIDLEVLNEVIAREERIRFDIVEQLEAVR